ncbi:XrtA-associated tyrosine autokinase [Pseudomonadota bacterium]
MNTIEKALERLRKEQENGGRDQDQGQVTAESDVSPVESVAPLPPLAEESSPVFDHTSHSSQQELEPQASGADVSAQGTPAESAQEGGQVSRRLDLDLERLARSGFLTPDAGRSQLAEEMRHIKRPLMLNASTPGEEFADANLIMVTSSKPSEGKTYTSLNLAMSVAKERDRTVLLVDADVAKPGVTRVLGVNKEKGLVDYLSDDSVMLSDVMLKTNISNMRFIPAGKRHVHSTELLSSQSMIELVEQLRSRYPDRIVIFDSPPLLATSEAVVLTELVGQIILVVEAEKTSKQEVEEAISQIGEDKSVGLVLNKARGSFGSDFYGYYGTYGE